MNSRYPHLYRPLPPDRWVTPEAYPFLIPGGMMSLLCFLVGWVGSGIVCVVGTFAIALFFRNPKRRPPAVAEGIASPADGKVIAIDEVFEERYLNQPTRRLSIFMSVKNVHVNRAPIAGRIAHLEYFPGKFHLAFVDKASKENEHLVTVLEDVKGRRLMMVQIAGWLARRIVSYLQPGISVAQGERLGMIRFGSRVDLYLSADVEMAVRVGDKVRAGESLIARWICAKNPSFEKR